MNVLDHLISVKSAALLPHVNPDWDAYGSCLALRAVLRERGVECDIIVDEPLSFHLNFLDTDVLIYDKDKNYNYETVCAVDGSEASRFGERAALFESAKTIACIDHHLSEGFGDISRIVPEAAATAEVIYDLMTESGIALDEKTARPLYCALASDTGSFRYTNTTAHTAEVFGAILKTGMNLSEVANLLYFRDTLPQLKLRAKAIETIELYAEDRVGVCTITTDMIKESGASRDDAGALSALPKNIYTVEASAVLKEEENGSVKVSLRGDGDINVQEIAALYGGGGHVKAAGATIEGSIEEVKALILPHLIKAVEK